MSKHITQRNRERDESGEYVMRAACGLLLKLSPWQEASCKFMQAYGGGGPEGGGLLCADSECTCGGDWARSSVDMTHFKPFKGIPRVLPAKDI